MSDKELDALRGAFDDAQARAERLKGPGRREELQRRLGGLQAQLQGGTLSDGEAAKVGAEAAGVREQIATLGGEEAERTRALTETRQEMLRAKGALKNGLTAHFSKQIAPTLERVKGHVAAIFDELDALDDKRMALTREYKMSPEGPTNVWLAMQGLLAALHAQPHQSPSERAHYEATRKAIEARKTAGAAS